MPSLPTLDRRHILLSGMGAALLPTISLAQVRGPLLPSPRFPLTPDTARFEVRTGVRPFRYDSYRLEPQPEPFGDKQIVHNYGHGGGGITLSWGARNRLGRWSPP